VSNSTPFVFDPTGEAKRHAPATERNRDAIVEVLQGILPPGGQVLEIASGTGEHIVHFARSFPHLTWQPSDPDPVALASIKAWREETASSNLLQPIQIDASAEWPVDHADAIICINMVHISPWAATGGLFRNAGRVLPIRGLLYLYGPYRRHGMPTAPSNDQFDQSLKERNPAWGLRQVEEVVAEAATAGLFLEHLVEMPANNVSLIFRLERFTNSTAD
jgi:SAM-dependent methyltransferase